MTEGPYKLPSGWQWVKLGEIFELQQGASMSPKRRRGVSPLPFLRTVNVRWGDVDLSNLDTMDFSKEEISSLALKTGDLLVCEGGEVGRTAIWKGGVGTCLYQNHIHRLRARIANILPEWFMHWMKAAYKVFGTYAGMESRTAIPNLSGRRLKEFLAPLPPLDEQRHIVAKIDSLMERIREAWRLRAAARQDADRLLQSALAETFPRPGSALPEGWRWVELKEIAAEVRSGFAFGKKRAQNGDILHLRPYNIGIVGALDLKDQFFIPSDTVPEGERRLKPGDVLFNNTNSVQLVGKTALVRESIEGAFSNHITLIRIKPNLCGGAWLALWFRALWERGFFAERCNKWIGQAGYNTRMLEATLIPLALLDEQWRIVAHLEQVQAKAQSIKQAQVETETKLQHLEQVILNRAFKGEL